MSYTALPTKNEDDPAVNGDPGLAILGVRQDADASPVSADGDYQTMLFNNAGRLKVAAMPGDYSPVVGNITAIGQTVACDVSRASNVMMYCTGVFGAVTCLFEASIDGGVSWFGTQAVRSNANTVEITTGSLTVSVTPIAYAWELSVNACTNVRVRSTTYTSGTQTWRIQPGAYATEPIPAIQTHAVTGSVTVTGTVTASPGYTTTAGLSSNFITATTTNPLLIKATSGYLYELTVSNITATAMYVKLYNKATAPTVGTDMPVFTLSAPANTTVAIPFGNVGKRFTLGIGIAVTGASVATDTTATVAGCQISTTYV